MILPVTLIGGPLDGHEQLYACDPNPPSAILAVSSDGRYATYRRRRNSMLYDYVPLNPRLKHEPQP